MRSHHPGLAAGDGRTPSVAVPGKMVPAAEQIWRDSAAARAAQS